MKKKQKNNPVLITAQDSNMKITEKKVVVASVYDSSEQLQIIYDSFSRKKMITINFGRLMSPETTVKISVEDFINKFFPGLKDLPF